MREKTYGRTNLVNTVELAGSRMVAVGGAIYAVDPKMQPLNFMAQLLVVTLGKEWFAKALESTPNHPIISFYRDAMAWQDRHADPVTNRVTGRPSGPVSAWFLLAYDVWVLQHNQLLVPLLDRLRDPDQFQGARYELTVFAIFVRAGFKIDANDTTDGNGRHVEFTASHMGLGERVAVEAKSKHRPGILGFASAGHSRAEQKTNISGLLRTALAQARRMPYVICVETNLAPSLDEAVTQRRWDAAHEEIELIESEYRSNNEPFPANLVVVTNYPHHYGGPLDTDTPTDYVVIGVRRPAFPFLNPETTAEIGAALDQYGNLPLEWSDLDS